jgi:hypothetical protein
MGIKDVQTIEKVLPCPPHGTSHQKGRVVLGSFPDSSQTRAQCTEACAHEFTIHTKPFNTPHRSFYEILKLFVRNKILKMGPVLFK